MARQARAGSGVIVMIGLLGALERLEENDQVGDLAAVEYWM